MSNALSVKKQLVIKVENDPNKYGVILFPLFNIMSFISAFFINLRAGALAGIIILIYVLMHKNCLKCFKDAGFLIFYSANIFSIYAYIFNERPVIIFASCITYNLLPMLMYGIGKASTAKERENPLLRALILSNIVIVAIGLIIYFSPSLALRVSMDSINTAGINYAGKGYRFGSYMGSLELGSICAISVPLLLMQKFKNNLVKPVFLLLFSVAILLTMQRGAWIVGTVSVAACMAIQAVFYHKGFKAIFGYALLGFVIMAVLLYFVDHFMSAGLLQHLKIRLQHFNLTHMSEGRSTQASKGIELFLQYPLGFGLGAAGNKASAYHMQVVSDGNLIRILADAEQQAVRA